MATLMAFALLLVTLLLSTPGMAQAVAPGGPGGASPQEVMAAEERAEILPVIAGWSRLLRFEDLSRAAVGDPGIADAVVISSKELVVNGKSPGITTLHIWDARKVHIFRVEVHRDLKSVAERVRELIGIPSVSVKVANETLLLEGSVGNDEDKARASGIARAFCSKVLDFISVVREPGRARPGEPEEPSPGEEKATPPLLSAAISEKIGDPRVKVMSVGDAVLLEGVVDDERERVRAEAIARLFTGRVTNLIEVPERFEVPEGPEDETVKPLPGPAFMATPAEEGVAPIKREVISAKQEAVPVTQEATTEKREEQKPEPSLQDLVPEIVEMIDIPEVRVKVARGTLILEGTVDSRDKSERAEKIAKAYTGKVINVITVTTPPATLEMPEKVRLAQEVREAIGIPGVSVRVANKTVILEGRVQDQGEADRAEEVARAYADRVLNFLTVERLERKPEGKEEPQLKAPAAEVSTPGTATPGEPLAPPPATVISGKDGSRPVEEIVKSLIGVEGVKVVSAGDSLLLEGEVATQNDAARAKTIAELFGKKVVSLIRVRNPIQVLLQVQVVEARRNLGQDLGIRWEGVTGQEAIGLPATEMVPSVSSTQSLLSPQIGLIGEVFAGSPLERLSLFRARIDALAQKGLVRLLAAPSMLTLGGQEANFLVGGEIPIFLGQEDGKIKFEWKPYGVRLSITPAVDDLGNIDVRVSPEVSSFDWENALLVSGWKIPAFKTRRAETHLVVSDGSTIALGGLIQAEDTKVQDKIPLLGDIPVIGALFRSERFQKQETELLIFVTPRIVRLGETVPPGGLIRPPVLKDMPDSLTDPEHLTRDVRR
ncbi:MAG TPA: BON domain-containing protein [Firmicutes bacterium]|nr:BON domain-containing protein [Bacillota bacterium]